jgi:hypothetical protein
VASQFSTFGISTYWNRGRHHDCAAAISEIIELDVGLIEVQLTTDPEDLTTAVEVLQRTKAKCHSVALAPDHSDPVRSPTLFHTDADLRQAAEARLQVAIKSAARLRSKTVVLDAGVVPVVDCESRMRTLLNAVDEREMDVASKVYEQLFIERTKVRDRAVEELCRALHRVIKEQPGLTLAMAPSAHPLALVGKEEAEWLLDDLRTGISIRLDPASITIRENFGRPSLMSWAESMSNAIDTTYLSEPEGVRVDSMPGPGLVDWAELAARLSPQTTSILKVDPASSRVAVTQAIRSFGRGLA